MKKLITLSTLLLCGFTLAACNTNTGKKDTTTITSQETAEATTTVPTKDTQWVGSDDYGYLKVPKSWVQSNVGGEKSVDFKYNDGTDKNAISVKSIKADVQDFTNFETKFVQNIKENPRFTNVRTNRGNIGGYDALKIYADYKNSKKVLIWVFKSDDNMIRLVTLEGDLEIVNEMTPIVEESWTVKKN